MQIPEDQQRVILSLTLSIPLSYTLRFLPNRFSKQVYSFILGTLLQLYVYQRELHYLFALHFLVYGVTAAMPRRCGPVVTALALLLLSIYHVKRMMVDYGSWNLDISTVLMTMVCKYSLYAYAVQDGQTKPEQLTGQQKRNRIEHIPSIFSYLSYCQFLPTAVIGTAVDYKVYENYMSGKQQFDSIPSPWKKIIEDIGYSVIMVVIYLLGELYYPLKHMQSADFPSNTCLFLIYYCVISVTLARFKYYFAWKFSMGAVHASGISYQMHADGKSDFLRIQTCNPHLVEATMQTRIKIANWNMSAQYWLRRCIYERSPSKNRSTNQIITFLVSSFWHGYYGGYYVGFVLWFAQTHLQQIVFNEMKREKSFYVRYYQMTGIVGKCFLWLAVNLLFSFSGTFFMVLSVSQSLKILRSTYFFSPIIIFGLIALFTFVPGGKRISRPKSSNTQQSSSGNQRKDK